MVIVSVLLNLCVGRKKQHRMGTAHPVLLFSQRLSGGAVIERHLHLGAEAAAAKTILAVASGAAAGDAADEAADIAAHTHSRSRPL